MTENITTFFSTQQLNMSYYFTVSSDCDALF